MLSQPADLAFAPEHLQYCDDLAKSGTEHAHQRAFFAWLGRMYYLGRFPLAHMAFAVPNGGKREAATAGRLKAEGVKSGVPDVVFPVPVGKYAGLFIEMKIVGGTVSKEQHGWHANLLEQHYAVAVCWNWREARQAFLDYTSNFPVLLDYKGRT